MRKIIGVFVGGIAIAGLLTLAPTPADAQAAGMLTVTKTVVGPGPTGPYTIEVMCTLKPAMPSSFELNDGESQPVAFEGPSTCTVTETGTQGASVSYACGMTIDAAVCDDDQTVTITCDGNAQVDITNTFPESEAEPAAAEPVEAAPTFTG